MRANVPLAALVTFVTNPFTLPFWLVIANRIGNLTLHFDAAGPAIAATRVDTGMWAFLINLYEVGMATVVGYLVLSIAAPAVGYLLSGWIWRAVVSRKWAKRLKVMEARLDQRLGSQ